MSVFIGLMSGTSMDGIDAAIVDVSTHTLIKGITRPYSPALRQQLCAVLSDACTNAAILSQVNTLIGREFAAAVSQVLESANMASTSIKAIGSHGQTIVHDPGASIPYTVQLGCAHTIAELTGIDVVADFRTRDLVLGGQGAPFAPLYHQAVLAKDIPTVVVNIGGIANISCLLPDKVVTGFDTGPGNCLMDAWTQQHLNVSYDKDGGWAASGCVIESLLSHLLSDDYFHISKPKSIDNGYFSNGWLMNYLDSHGAYAPQDIQATLCALTARSIAIEVLAVIPVVSQVFVCGGGVHNQTLMQALRQQLPGIMVESTTNIGVDADFMEAMMFAWLAEKTLNRVAVDFTSITGACRPAILGAIYPGSTGF